MKRKILHLFGTLLLLIMAQQGNGQTTIFDYGSSWKYLDNGSNQGTAWTGTGFSDAGWASDTGFFGYADSWITKYVNACGTVSSAPTCTNKYITTYFRKVVSIASTTLYDSVELNIKRDDGFVVYVNGTEVWRDNMPTGTIAYNTTASTAIGSADEYTAIKKRIPISFFTNGNNTIAVELHQQSGTSSDLGFNMQMKGIVRTQIFPFGDAWKYLTTGTDQGTPWRGTSFSDVAWLTGTGHIGYGESWTNTCITPAASGCTAGCTPGSCTKYNTTYFRKTVNLADVSLFDSMRFSVFRDDGIVMYVNGTEVWRDNMPTGTIAYNTLAPNVINGSTGTYAESLAVVKSIPITAFVNGNNVIAIELHQNSTTSSDLDFNVQMTGVIRVPPVPVTLSQGPYLQMGSKTAVNVRWRTNIASKSKVEVGTVAGTYPIVVNDAVLRTEHEIRVTGLNPDTKYFYRIGTDTSVTQGDTTNFFVTAPDDTATRRVTLAVFGDCGRNDNNYQTGSLTAYQNYISAQGMKAADIMMLVGDNAYNNGTDAEFSTNFFARYSSNVLKNHMLFPAPGNHDYDNGSAARQVDHNVPYYSLFSLPTAGESGGVPSGTEAYYSFDWGANVHVLSLDSYGKEDAGTTRLYDTLGAQVNWIKNDLALNTKKWVIVYFHHPPYTMGSHNSNTETELVNIRQNFIRILERYGVDMVICGHSHDYERSYLLKGHYGNEASFSKAAHTTDSSSAKYNGTANSCPYTYPSGKIEHGTVYVLSGSAGASGGVQSGYPHNALPFAVNDGGMFYIDIKDNRLDAKFLRRDNSIFDQFTIIKDTKVKDTTTILAGQPVNLAASWPGAYAWSTGAVTKSITFTAPDKDTLITVKDSIVNTCIADEHFINVTCTVPVFTTCPSNISQSGCNNVVSYSVADTGTPNPVLSYTFTGATTGSGFGTGSGSTFNTGLTMVTLYATNMCGDTTACSFTVTIDPLPAAVTASGAGTYCDNTTITAANGSDGIIYFQGTTSGGTSTATPSTSEVITASGTYYFRAQSASGCWGAEGSVTVTIEPLPTPVTVSGAGTFCGSNTITTSGGAGGTVYFQGTTTGGLSTATPSVSEVITSSGTYYFRSQSAFGCWSQEGSANLTINPLPTTVTVSGAGTYCGAVTITAANGGSGTIYYQGATSGGTTTATVASSQLITTSGTYYFRAQSSAGCWGNEGSAAVTVHPLPSVYTLTGGGSYCAGGAGVAIGLNNSAVGINYELYRGSVPTGIILPGTGSSLNFGMQTIVGSYTIIATDAVTACTSNMSGSAAIIIKPLPAVYTVTGGGSYCSGDAGVHIGLTASNNGVNYQLYRGGTAVGSALPGIGASLDFGLLTSAGTYTVTATDPGTGCSNNMTGSAVVTVNTRPSVYTVDGGGSYCIGGSGVVVGINNSQLGVDYQLYNGASPAGAPIAGTGTWFSFGLQTGAGSYSAVATNTVTGCSRTMTSGAAVSINPLPVIYNVTGGGSYCTGGTGVAVGLDNADNGVEYQLYDGGIASGSPMSGTGAVLDFGLQTNASAYTVVATDPVTMCSSSMNGAASVTVDPLVVPSVAVATSPGTSLCEGTTAIFNATAIHGGSMPAYTWMVNGVNMGTGYSYSYTPAAGDTVSVSLLSNDACASPATASTVIPMTVIANELPVVAVSADPGVAVCEGTSVTLTASDSFGGTAPAYNWFLNGGNVGSASAYHFVPVNGDIVYCVLVSNYDCRLANTANSANVLMKVVEPQVPAIVITASPGLRILQGKSDTLTAKVVSGGVNPKYQWYINSTLVVGATSAKYISNNFANKDSVTCVVTNQDECALYTFNSVFISIKTTGINGVSGANDVTVAPNPNKGEFTINGFVGNNDPEAQLELTNMLGQVVYRNTVSLQHGMINEHIQLDRSLANGMYILNIHSGTASQVFHMVLGR